MNPLDQILKEVDRQNGRQTPFPTPKIGPNPATNDRLAELEAHVNNLELRMREAGAGFAIAGQHIAEVNEKLELLRGVVNNNAVEFNKLVGMHQQAANPLATKDTERLAEARKRIEELHKEQRRVQVEKETALDALAIANAKVAELEDEVRLIRSATAAKKKAKPKKPAAK